VAALIALLLRLFVLQSFFVPSCSMWPTLRPGDRMLVLKVGDSLSRGAIVVFTRPSRDISAPPDEDLVKRIIGLPKETIWSRNNTVYINGKPLAQPWLPRQEQDALGAPIRRQRIPAGDYFMLGDNRGDSYDSRYWGPIPGSTIIGRVMLVVWRDGRPALQTVGGQAAMPRQACPPSP
jgi:signal peptidase I